MVSEAQILAIRVECGDAVETLSGWTDSSCLDHLLVAARSFGVLLDVDVFQLLDEDERDIVLVSVELRPGVFAHAPPAKWDEIRPASDVLGVRAVRHVLGRLRDIAGRVRADHGERRRA
ncbi:hypothetical protein [Streptomyces sp. NBC_01198]|uniref:hypothetical protein n=1 Tax=Streptomyces sp. NBC_01198 TaxID=2903769 RepID=UPI002E1287A5|nr:hypothetical protein OG702_21080 [Streptomyces sp. NBC_01198]